MPSSYAVRVIGSEQAALDFIEQRMLKNLRADCLASVIAFAPVYCIQERFQAMRNQSLFVRLFVAACIVTVISPICALAQAIPDLAGAWILDAAKSDAIPVPAGRGGAAAASVNQLVIKQTPAAVTMTQGQQTYIFNFDGSETFLSDGRAAKATAKWDGDKLVISWKGEYFAGPAKGYMTTSGQEIYTVSGNVLTVEKNQNTQKG